MTFDPKKHFFLASALALIAVLLVISTLRIAVAAIGPGPAAQRGAGRATPISVVEAAPRRFTDTLEVLGVAKGRQSVTITSSTMELVTATHFSDGEHVKKGQPLVDLKAKEEDAGVDQARAAVAQAKIEDERWARLAAADVASKEQAEQYHTAYLQALANLNAARSRVGDRQIRAPFAGVVGLSDIAPGALISPGAPIVTLDDVSAVRIDFDVPDRYLAQLHEGEPITATSDTYPDQLVHGRIAKIDSRIDTNTRSIKARAEFANADGKLKPGMLMHVHIDRDARTAVAAPEAAVAIESTTPFVYVLADRAGRVTAQRREVTIGANQDGFVEIKAGLRAGERIVADGLDRLQPNQPVRIIGGAASHSQPARVRPEAHSDAEERAEAGPPATRLQ